ERWRRWRQEPHPGRTLSPRFDAGAIVKTSLAMLRAASCSITVAAVLIAAPAADAQTGTCDGIPAPVRNAKLVRGGTGDDVLRGGTNIDCFYGDGGLNTASFATATPPGVPRLGIDGVRVELRHAAQGRCPRRGRGRAVGDANGVEVLDRIQFVIGSAFADS